MKESPKEPLTVNQLISHLQAMADAGRGDQRVFIHRAGDKWCMPAVEVKDHGHPGQNGHLVIIAQDPASFGWDKE